MGTIADFLRKYDLSLDQKCFWFSSIDLIETVIVFKAVFGSDVCEVRIDPECISHEIHDVYPDTKLSLCVLKPDKIVVSNWNDMTSHVDVVEYEGY
jgi:hypothetical protein